ncbi:hypothetical protein VD0002_g2219 [Verticillium dahliae]|uniref:Heme oxygenase n=2 Tax=Verticillium dahliae TaxID=27337 RepID=G2WUG2_VERDV|nr:uncharacterized protein VDAG_01435 [Verticillium dahliae VdLs.17]KAF3348241.1 Phosphoribosylformylglycinamidine synthase [Verticillium dahliae VDG2]KAH6698572.1 hypothetical protein EV126DRAFT_47934 [Verticillium dahliae]EGY17753.1 hypothetical protein VDAG_01435 [Verticillium dahliae VdLs.17]PNH35468.1 hypothetical protein BJF96_g1441 [Verticillium dahliae]PNH44666.1 hypothetical protein VD0004_g3062 [Verticillium dahliae]
MLSSTEASASSGSPQRPLSDSINAATRTIHAKLNKLIIARLPLSLPPHAQDPSTYASGLLHIAPIYITFESWWHSLVSAPPAPGADAAADRIHDILSGIYFPDLMRADRLRADIAHLTGWSIDTVNEKLDTVARHGSLADFLRHISRALENRPHVLIAYAYILFMALFAGGRFIRATLESVDTSAPEPGFWNRRPVPGAPGDPLPLSFFRFNGSVDGEDLKRDFKASLASIEPLLSAHDRHDVVQEAICIFDNMLRLVGQLDVFCNTDLEAEPAPFGSRLRNSVAVAKERRAAAAASSGDDSPERSHSHHQCPATRAAGSDESADLEGTGRFCPMLGKAVRFEPKPSTPERVRRVDKLRSMFSGDGSSSRRGSLVDTVTSRTSAKLSLLSNVLLLAAAVGLMATFYFSKGRREESVL